MGIGGLEIYLMITYISWHVSKKGHVSYINNSIIQIYIKSRDTSSIEDVFGSRTKLEGVWG
jgi:hypothetical protein